MGVVMTAAVFFPSFRRCHELSVVAVAAIYSLGVAYDSKKQWYLRGRGHQVQDEVCLKSSKIQWSSPFDIRVAVC
jgi:hypothetical protein